MPSTSKSQQRLFCMAYAVRKGKIKRSDANEEVLKIADSDMTDQEIKDFMKLKESQFISLQTYITERLNPRHLGSVNKFPIDGTIKDIIKFLESCEFVQIPSVKGFNRTKEAFNSSKSRCFINNPSGDAIWFADTSKGIISYKNNVFSVDDSIDSSRRYYIWTNDGIYNATRETFLKEINKNFGF